MRKLSYKTYLDKAYGCWLGKSIGGACGALSENNKALLHYTLDNVFPEVIPPNDDLDLQVLWLVDLLEKKGTALTTTDFAKSFAAHNICLANEYSVAIRNVECGILPPTSGLFTNNYFKCSMGCPIRSEIWGVVAPGSPETAKSYAMADGIVDHDMPSVYFEIFNAVMECEAFFEDDIEKLIAKGLEYIPEDCIIYDVVTYALDLYKSGTPWEKARNRLVARFGAQDASYAPVNCGLILFSLLYGEKDYTNTLLYSVNGGYDTDCTAATALSILGIITGAKNTPEFWLNKIGSGLVVGTIDIECPYKTIESFSEASVKAGLSFFEEGLLDIEITDIPDGIKGSLPQSEYPEISIVADYEGIPSIGVGEKRAVTLTVTNNSDDEVSGTLAITPAPALEIIGDSSAKISLKPGTSCAVTAVLTSKGDVMPMTNISTAVFGEAKCEFGFLGAMSMKLIGPFSDNYDTTIYDSDPYNERMQRTPDGELDIAAMFSGFVSVNREYIDESFENLDEIIADDTITQDVNIHGDIFDLQERITYRGPACVYLVYDFVSEESFTGTHHFGCTAPFKVWENGKLIMDSQAHRSWTPYNNSSDATIKKGNNRIIFKITRCDEFKFSWSTRNSQNMERLFHKMESPVK